MSKHESPEKKRANKAKAKERKAADNRNASRGAIAASNRACGSDVASTSSSVAKVGGAIAVKASWLTGGKQLTVGTAKPDSRSKRTAAHEPEEKGGRSFKAEWQDEKKGGNKYLMHDPEYGMWCSLCSCKEKATTHYKKDVVHKHMTSDTHIAAAKARKDKEEKVQPDAAQAVEAIQEVAQPEYALKLRAMAYLLNNARPLSECVFLHLPRVCACNDCMCSAVSLAKGHVCVAMAHTLTTCEHV